MDVVADRSQPRRPRLVALSVMHYYVTGSYVLYGTALMDLPRPRIIVGGGGHNIAPIMGSQPLVGDVRQRLIAHLRPLAENTADDSLVLMAIRETIQMFGGDDR